jgi:predicted aconitase
MNINSISYFSNPKQMPAGDSNATVYINTGFGARGPPLELFLAKSKAVRAKTKVANCDVKERKANNVIPCEIKFREKFNSMGN